MPHQPELSSSHFRTAAKSSASRPLLSAKAARKRITSEESTSDSLSGDGHSAIARGNQHDDSDSDALQRRSNQAVGGHRRPNLSTKTAKKVAFNVQDDSASDDGTVRADPSQHRGRNNLPAKSGAFFLKSPPAKQSGPKGGQPPRSAAPNPLDSTNYKPTKSTRRYRLSGAELISWKGKFARKEYEGGGKRYSRMSIGGAGPSRPSGTSDVTHTKGANRKWYVRDGTVVPRGSIGSEGSDDEDLYAPPKLSTAKAARKFQVGVKSQPPGPKKPVHEIGIDVIDKDDYEAHDTVDDVADEPAYDAPVATASGSDHEEHMEPSEALLEGLERISLSSVHLQKLRRLPFLRRNLQDGFAHRCKLAGVPTKRISLPRASISVIYHCPLATTVLGSPRKTPPTAARSSMKDWFCPLCSLHRNFANQMMLDKHLSWDHPSVKALWDEHHNVLTLTIPPLVPEPHVRPTYQVPVPEPSQTSFDLSSNTTQVTRAKRADLDQKVFDRASAAPSSASTEPTSSTITTSNTEEDIKPKYSPSRHSSQVTDSERRSDTISSRPPSQGPSGTKPRLPQDILGPEATFPYLPEDIERGDVYYSCRPGGPRLYDILNTLSLEPYGVLKWVIVDREEELFELDDVLDEDKVIQALWFRWIFLNRNRFVANYFNGTKAFVTENWQLIKKAAGLLALRTWLLVLCVNNFLLPLEVVTLMGYYQELVGVQLA